MLYDFVLIDRQNGIPLYRQLYEALGEGIRMGKLRPGQPLPSIREAAAVLHISKITVEDAYRRLCVDGYVCSRPKSGYVVRDTLPRRTRPPAKPMEDAVSPYRYDLGTGSVDPSVSDIGVWQYHLRKVLTQRKDILSYGEPQGETSLRRELAMYAYTSRGVEADAERIVIGAGIQPLLSLLCGLLGIRGRVSLQEPELPQASRIFKDFGYTVLPFNVSEGLRNSLDVSGAPLCFVMPTLCDNDVSYVSYRDSLYNWLKAAQGRLLIEDDYNGELRYATDSVPALQGGNPDRIIYIGSFSKLLLPSIRISYMVLPPELMARYRSFPDGYNQTASKIEQLALARYLHEGELERHLRRLRKQYRLKSQVFEHAFTASFGDSVRLRLNESKLCFYLYPRLHGNVSMDGRSSIVSRLVEAAKQEGIRILPAPTHQYGPVLVAGFSGMDVDDVPAAIERLYEAWKGYLVE